MNNYDIISEDLKELDSLFLNAAFRPEPTYIPIPNFGGYMAQVVVLSKTTYKLLYEIVVRIMGDRHNENLARIEFSFYNHILDNDFIITAEKTYSVDDLNKLIKLANRLIQNFPDFLYEKFNTKPFTEKDFKYLIQKLNFNSDPVWNVDW